MSPLRIREQAEKIIRKYVIYVALPLVLAIAIYVAFRPNPPLLLLTIMDQLSMTQRPVSLGSGFDWFVYNVPDALWAFSFSSFLLITCQNDHPNSRKLYLACGLIVMFGYEAAQGSYLPGTYDHLDVVATVVGMGLSYLLLYRSTCQQLDSPDNL